MKQILIDILGDSTSNVTMISKILKMYYPVLKINKIIQKNSISIQEIIDKKPNVVFVSLNLTNNEELMNSIIKEGIIIVAIIDSNKEALIAFKCNILYCIKKPIEYIKINEAINKVFTRFLLLN